MSRDGHDVGQKEHIVARTTGNDARNPTVVLDNMEPCADSMLVVPGWPQLTLVHATVDNRSLGGRHRACHRHAVYHAVVVTEGQGSFLAGSDEISIDQPTLFLCSPWESHSFIRRIGDSTVYSEVTFQAVDGEDHGDWNDLLAAWTGAPCRLPMVQPVSRQFAVALRALIARVADPGLLGVAHGATMVRGLLTQVLFEIWSQLAVQGHGPDQDPLEDARRFLEANADRAMSLEEFAASMQCSPKHAGRSFRQRFSQPPMQYHRACCLRRAAVLLRTTAHPLKQIAAMCGFDDTQYFNRAFRRSHGIAPGAYRARYVQG